MPSDLTVFQIAIACSFAYLLSQFIRKFTKSPLRNLPGPASKSFLRGSFEQLFDRHGWDFQDELGEKYGPVVKITGLLGKEYLFIFDPKALHQVVVKDQDIYQLSRWSTASFQYMIGPGLLTTYRDQHRRQRKLLNPAFSIKHMRHITPIFYHVTRKLRDAVFHQVKSGPQDIDMLRWLNRGALELIGQGALGYSFDSLVEDQPPNDFAVALKNVIPTLFSLSTLRLLSEYIKYLGSPTFRRKLIDVAPIPALHTLKKYIDIIDTRSWEIYNSKKAAFEAGEDVTADQVADGKDVMSILLKEKMKASGEDKLTDEELIANMSILVVAGTDTTTAAMTHILQLLAENPHIQDQLRQEIHENMTNDDIPYDTLIDLPLLDAVCRETLRLYPPVSFVFRETFEDSVIPLSRPATGVNGKLIFEIPVTKGTGIIVGIRASNRNKEIWGEDAHEWKPERWLSPLPATVTDARIPGVYSNLMTFFGGGRSCIGFKFSQLEMKVVLSMLLHSFRFSLPNNSEDIVWNLANIKYPTIGKDSNTPSFPMKVERVNGDSEL